MAKLTLTDITSGYGTATKLNANNSAIETAMENTLSRDGTEPNEMNAHLDMNGNEILNVGAPTSGSSAARWADVTDGLELTGTAVPALTGNSGKFLTNDGTDLSWATVAVSEAAVTTHQAALTILETQITDGSLLARVAGNETISGTWNFTTAPTISNATIGYLGVPRLSGTGGTADATWKGKCYASTGGVTIPNSVFAAGDTISIYNDSGSAITITQGSGVTLRWAGTASTGNRTLAQRGMVTIWFNGASEAVLMGTGVT